MIQDVATLPSGAKLSMQPAPWGVVGQLRRLLARELKAVDLDISSSFVSSLLRVAMMDGKDEKAKAEKRAAVLQALGGEDLDTVKNLLLQLVGSSEVEGALFDCLLHCTYNGVKIVPDIFEPEDARSDYYPIVWEVLKLNLRPFFKSLVSTSSAPSSPKGAVRK